jgi:uncharacterized protein (DUF983 family)
LKSFDRAALEGKRALRVWTHLIITLPVYMIITLPGLQVV